jgi:FKBP-type peptidyl-prolyl cis-trans isomerase FkpA
MIHETGAFFSGEFRERCTAYENAVKEGSTAPFKPFSTKKQCKTISYSFGVDVGNNLYRANHPILINWVCSGLEDAWTENLVMDKEQVLYYLSHYFMTVVPARNNARSKAWLEAKRSEEGVKSTESGLLYKVVKAGDMSKVAKSDGDVVKVHYVGRLQNGTVFDASRFESRSEEHKALIRKHQPEKFDKNGNLIGEDSPIEFPLNRVILGWTEGMKLIGPGGKIILYIPAELAYGNRGAGGIIGPNEALEFEVELIEVIPETKR